MDLPEPGIEWGSPALQMNSLSAELLGIYINTGYIGCMYIFIGYIYMCIYMYVCIYVYIYIGYSVKGSNYQERDSGSIPGSGRSSGEGNSYSLQYSCLGNPMDREAWQATAYGVIELDTT